MSSGDEITTDGRAYEFSLLNLLYWTTLLALVIGTFGLGWGLYLTAWVATIQFAVASWRSGRRRAWNLVVLVAALHVLIALLLPALEAGQEPAPRHSSLNKLKQLGLALHNHQDVRGRMPAPRTRDSAGNPLHSWRTTLLPFVEDQTLYDQIDHSLAWNDPANGEIVPGTPLSDLEHYAYHSPRLPAVESPEWETHYFAIVGEETMWPEGGLASLHDVPDGSSETIMLIEAYGRGVRWCEPRDLTMEEAIDLLTGKGEGTWIDPGFVYSIRYRGDGCCPRLVAFADGYSQAIYPLGDRALARALLTRNGGEEIDLNKIQRLGVRNDPEAVETIINWLNLIPTTLYVGLALWPLFKKRDRMAPATP